MDFKSAMTVGGNDHHAAGGGGTSPRPRRQLAIAHARLLTSSID